MTPFCNDYNYKGCEQESVIVNYCNGIQIQEYSCTAIVYDGIIFLISLCIWAMYFSRLQLPSIRHLYILGLLVHGPLVSYVFYQCFFFFNVVNLFLFQYRSNCLCQDLHVYLYIVNVFSMEIWNKIKLSLLTDLEEFIILIHLSSCCFFL